MFFKFRRAVIFFFICCFSATLWAQAPLNYYESVDRGSAGQLRSSLHRVIDDHKRFPYTASSTDTWDILEKADEDKTNPNNVTAVYRNASFPKVGGGNNNYNREHSWPKSYGFPKDAASNYPYTDAHHLFIADARYNSSRGNGYFDDCSADCKREGSVANDGRGGENGAYPSDSNWRNDDSWEVWSNRKGDIARAMFYMDIRYEGGVHSKTKVKEPNLILTDNPQQIVSVKNNADVAYMGLLTTLIVWHQQDPVSDDEKTRNNVVFSFQGNRNPFVDHPEWVECLYLGACDDGDNSVLKNQDLKTGLAANKGEWVRFTMSVPQNARNLNFTLSGGAGDADLYVRRIVASTESSYDCRPWVNGNNENCAFDQPSSGTYHIGIRAYADFSGVTLKAEYDAQSEKPKTIQKEQKSLSGQQSQWRNYTIELPEGATNLKADIVGGRGDADLYLRRKNRPTRNLYDCQPGLTGNRESCQVLQPESGLWYVSLYGYGSYEDVDLTYSYDN